MTSDIQIENGGGESVSALTFMFSGSDHFLQIFLQFSENTISDDDGNLGFWANQS